MTMLEFWRRERKLTRNELSDITGISPHTITTWEQGRVDIEHAKINTLICLAKALDIKVIDLIKTESVKEEMKKYIL